MLLARRLKPLISESSRAAVSLGGGQGKALGSSQWPGNLRWPLLSWCLTSPPRNACRSLSYPGIFHLRTPYALAFSPSGAGNLAWLPEPRLSYQKLQRHRQAVHCNGCVTVTPGESRNSQNRPTRNCSPSSCASLKITLESNPFSLTAACICVSPLFMTFRGKSDYTNLL